MKLFCAFMFWIVGYTDAWSVNNDRALAPAPHQGIIQRVDQGGQLVQNSLLGKTPYKKMYDALRKVQGDLNAHLIVEEAIKYNIEKHLAAKTRAFQQNGHGHSQNYPDYKAFRRFFGPKNMQKMLCDIAYRTFDKTNGIITKSQQKNGPLPGSQILQIALDSYFRAAFLLFYDSLTHYKKPDVNLNYDLNINGSKNDNGVYGLFENNAFKSLTEQEQQNIKNSITNLENSFEKNPHEYIQFTLDAFEENTGGRALKKQQYGPWYDSLVILSSLISTLKREAIATHARSNEDAWNEIQTLMGYILRIVCGHFDPVDPKNTIDFSKGKPNLSKGHLIPLHAIVQASKAYKAFNENKHRHGANPLDRDDAFAYMDQHLSQMFVKNTDESATDHEMGVFILFVTELFRKGNIGHIKNLFERAEISPNRHLLHDIRKRYGHQLGRVIDNALSILNEYKAINTYRAPATQPAIQGAQPSPVVQNNRPLPNAPQPQIHHPLPRHNDNVVPPIQPNAVPPIQPNAVPPIQPNIVVGPIPTPPPPPAVQGLTNISNHVGLPDAIQNVRLKKLPSANQPNPTDADDRNGDIMNALVQTMGARRNAMNFNDDGDENFNTDNNLVGDDDWG